MTAQQEVDEMTQQEGGVEGYSGPEVGSPLVGGKKRRRGSRKSTRKAPKRKGSKRKGTKKKRGPSKWIMHVKAFCKKTGKNFPEALKDPMCRKTFKH